MQLTYTHLFLPKSVSSVKIEFALLNFDYNSFCLDLLRRCLKMARTCDICNKGKMSGNTVSHSNRKGRRAWTPNLKKVKMESDGVVKTLNACTRCIRTGKIKSS